MSTRIDKKILSKHANDFFFQILILINIFEFKWSKTAVQVPITMQSNI